MCLQSAPSHSGAITLEDTHKSCLPENLQLSSAEAFPAHLSYRSIGPRLLMLLSQKHFLTHQSQGWVLI